jgi:hypothetical protein
VRYLLLFAALIYTLSGCGGAPTAETKPSTPVNSPTAVAAEKSSAPIAASPGLAAQPTAEVAAAATPPAAESKAETAGQAAAQPTQVFAIDETVRTPATVEEAAKALDLTTFPLLPGTPELDRRSIAQLYYIAPGEVKAGYEFQRKNLIELGWKELTEPQVTGEYASGSFAKDGFAVSTSISPDEAGKVRVHLHNHSNLNLAKLPVPPGAKLQYSFPAVTSFVTEARPAETAAAVRELLLAQGWQPYGTAGDTQQFKQNAVELNARVLEPPAQPGKTFIDFTAKQLSADLPAPPDASSVQYADSNKRLDIYMPGTTETVVAYYQAALAPAGWKPTTDHAIKDGFERFMVFRNPAKEMLTLTMWGTQDDKGQTRAHIKHQSAAEVEEEERQYQAAVEAAKKKEEEERNKPKPKAIVTLPAGAQNIDATAREIEFHLPTGKGKAAVDALAKELVAAGWKADAPVGQAEAGQLSFKKDGHSVSILYVDPGFIPAEITITGSGVELERGTAK